MKTDLEVLDYAKIFSQVLRMRLWYGRILSICDVSMYLVTMKGPTNDVDKDNAFYAASTAIDGFDIYINTTASKDLVKRWMFHEIIEIIWRSFGKNEREAHALALQQEEIYFGKRET